MPKASKKPFNPTPPADALRIINDMCTCVKSGKGSGKVVFLINLKTGKNRTVALQDAVNAAFEAMTGESAKEWLKQDPERPKKKAKRIAKVSA